MNFITGNKFKKICDFILDEQGFKKTEVNNETPIYFVKTDYVDIFFEKFKPTTDFKLITHNSDFSISEKYKQYLDDKNLISWYGQNINYQHTKLNSIPIGIANEIWTHGDENIFNQIILTDNVKTNLIYCNFDIQTNVQERNKCFYSMNKNKLTMSKKTNFSNYLSELKNSFFCLSPNGNGIDCHKTWESMYLKTIPIVTDSINIRYYEDFPMLIIKNWEDFSVDQLTLDLYYELIKKYDLKKININYFYSIITN